VQPRVASTEAIATWNELSRCPYIKEAKTIVHPGEVRELGCEQDVCVPAASGTVRAGCWWLGSGGTFIGAVCATDQTTVKRSHSSGALCVLWLTGQPDVAITHR
jgi:hypothetical protein